MSIVVVALVGLGQTKASTLINGLYYDLYDDTKTAEVASNTSASGALTIADKVTSGSTDYTVTSITSNAFKNCTGLTSVTIPNTVTSIGSSAFNGCTNLATIVIPNTVTSIGYNAFTGTAWYNNQPDGVIYAGLLTYAYKYTSKPSSIIVRDGTIGISGNGFSLSSLISITIPSSVTHIMAGAFSDCSSLETINIADLAAWCKIKFDSKTANPMWNASPYRSHCLYLNGNAITALSIPSSITSIQDYAFFNNNSITSVSFETPSSVTSIGSSAFYNCSSLATISIPSSVTSIGINAFYGTSWYNKQPNGVVYLGTLAYKYKGTMPANTSIVLNANTTGIVEQAFASCTNLVSISIPGNVTSIGSSAFYNCSSLATINIPSSVKDIGSSAFSNTGLTSLNIPSSVTSIGEMTFGWCANLTSITLPEGITSIAYGMFTQCPSLASVNIPSSVTSIGAAAFVKCTSLTSITLPEGITSIGASAFTRCGLTSITIPNSVTSIAQNAFKGCSAAASLTFKGPSSLTEIGDSAFKYCSKLTAVTIPNTATHIGESAFEGCSAMASLTFEAPSSLTTLKQSIFKDCSALTSIDIPSSVTTLEVYFIKNCTNLSKILFRESSVPDIRDRGFTYNGDNPKIYVLSSISTQYGYVAQAHRYRFLSSPSGAANWGKVTSAAGAKGYIKTLSGGTTTYYRTFCPDYNAIVPEGVTAYKLSLNESKTGVTFTPEISSDGTNTVIPSGKGVLIASSDPEKLYDFLETKTALTVNDNADNILIGVTAKPTSLAAGSYLTLGYTDIDTEKSNLGFWVNTVINNMEANTAFIYASVLPASSKGFAFIGGNTTGIEQVTTNNNDKAVYYNLQGQQVNNPSHGIFIKNNKKVYIK